MTTKLCPFCAEEIQDAAVKCKHCGSMLGEASRGFFGGIGMTEDGKPRALVRVQDRMIAGVCGGLARYLQLDVNMVRLVCVVLLIVTAGCMSAFARSRIASWTSSRDNVQRQVEERSRPAGSKQRYEQVNDRLVLFEADLGLAATRTANERRHRQESPCARPVTFRFTRWPGRTTNCGSSTRGSRA